MWVRTEKDTYLNLDNGTSLAVKESKHRPEWRIVVLSSDGVTVTFAVQGGYSTEDDAQSALDALMEDLDTKVVEVRKPSEEEEDKPAPPPTKSRKPLRAESGDDK